MFELDLSYISFNTDNSYFLLYDRFCLFFEDQETFIQDLLIKNIRI